MARVRVKLPTPRELEKHVLEDELMLAKLIEEARIAQAFWKSIAPVGKASDGDKNPGQYRESIKFKVDRTDEGKGRVRVYTKDFKAHWIEYGAKRMPKYACMEKTRTYMLSRGFHVARTPGEWLEEKLDD